MRPWRWPPIPARVCCFGVPGSAACVASPQSPVVGVFGEAWLLRSGWVSTLPAGTLAFLVVRPALLPSSRLCLAAVRFTHGVRMLPAGAVGLAVVHSTPMCAFRLYSALSRKMVPSRPDRLWSSHRLVWLSITGWGGMGPRLLLNRLAWVGAGSAGMWKGHSHDHYL